MVLVCLNKTSETQAAILKAGSFCVNILAEGQQDLAYQFAGKGDKFASTTYEQGIDGVPVLGGTLAHLGCRVTETVTGGTHTVFLAHVATAAGHERAPLTYFRGRFGRLESAREEEAYAAVRVWVLARKVPLDQPLDPTALGGSLGLDPVHIAHALVRLAGEHVVSRTPTGATCPPRSPSSSPTSCSAPAASSSSASPTPAWATSPMPTSPSSTSTPSGWPRSWRRRPSLASSSTPATATTCTTSGWGQPAAAGHLRRARDLHAVAPGARRAGLAAAFDVAHHAALTQACRDGDVARARELIVEHTEQVRGLVRTLIDRAGGAL